VKGFARGEVEMKRGEGEESVREKNDDGIDDGKR
jgi:hypothetical protein